MGNWPTWVLKSKKSVKSVMALDGLNLEQDEKMGLKFPFWFPVIAKNGNRVWLMKLQIL